MQNKVAAKDIDDKSVNYFNCHDEIESKLVFGVVPNEVDLSIVLPAYKRIDTLKSAISSLNNLIPVDGFRCVFILVSNDPDFDYHSLNIDLDENRYLIYVNSKNLGMVGNINRCSKLSLGKYVAFLHDDDLLLPNYLVEMKKAIDSKAATGFDCIIPNRYLWNCNNPKIEKHSTIKRLMSKLAFWNQRKLVRVDYSDCAKTWENCFGGGPTCGILFRRESLLSTRGFDEHFPFIFDFVFFVNYSFEHKILLLNKFLSIYRMSEGASNKPETQFDFFEGNLAILKILYEKESFVRKNINYMIYDSYICRNDECRKLINEKYTLETISPTGYRFYKMKTGFRFIVKGLYRSSGIPKKLKRDLK